MIIYEEAHRNYYDALQAYYKREDLELLTDFFTAKAVKTWSRSMELNDSDVPQHKDLRFFML